MARRLNCALDWENAGYAPSGVHLLSYPHKSALSSESSAAAMGLDPTTCSDFAHSSSICSRGAQSIYSWFFLLCHVYLPYLLYQCHAQMTVMSDVSEASYKNRNTQRHLGGAGNGLFHVNRANDVML
jgi:hypothetical protein